MVKFLLLNWIKNGDLFGHPIELSFNKKGSKHKTTVGGVVSIFIKTLIAIYLYILVDRLIYYKNDINVSLANIQDVSKIG